MRESGALTLFRFPVDYPAAAGAGGGEAEAAGGKRGCRGEGAPW